MKKLIAILVLSCAAFAQQPVTTTLPSHLISAQAATGVITGAAVPVTPMSGSGTVWVTYASITGSPSTCQLTFYGYDSLGNKKQLTTSAINTTPANGTTAFSVPTAFSGFAAVSILGSAQVSVTYTCAAYPSGGTISVDYVPSAVVTLAGQSTVSIFGSTGLAFDGGVTAGPAPAGSLVVGGVYNTTAPVLSNGWSSSFQMDGAGNLKQVPGIFYLNNAATWTAATALNTTLALTPSQTGAQTITVTLFINNATFSTGAVTFEGSYNGSTTSAVLEAYRVTDPSTAATVAVPYTLVANTTKTFVLNVTGFTNVQAKLSTAITGSGSPQVVLYYAQFPYVPRPLTTAAGNQQIDVTTIAGTAPSTAGKLDVKAADGDLFARLASGSVASGAVASGAIASGAIASGAFASGSVSDGAIVTLGAKADAKSTATDTTAITMMSVLKEISAMEQAPASRAVTIADGSDTTLGTKTDAADAHTDGTSISVMQVLKEISAKAQSPAALPNNQSTNTAQIGGAAIVANVCQQAAPTVLAISQATASLTTIISGVSAKHVYICSIALLSATAQNINIVAGTGTNCGTTVHIGFFGGTTAATGLNLGANGGLTLGNGAAVIAGGTDTAADNICYTSSSTGQVSGVLTYVQQ